MQPLVSFITTLIILGMVMTLLHWLIFSLNLPDIVALLLFAIPLTVYIAYCTQETRGKMWRSAITMYAAFAGVTLSAVGLVLFIG